LESWSKVEAFNDGVIKSMTFTLPSATFRYDDIRDSIPHSITGQSPTGTSHNVGSSM